MTQHRILRAAAMIAGLPPSPPERLQNAPLKSMVAELRFPYEPRLGTPEVLGEFHDPLRTRYPRMAPEQQISLSVAAGGVQPQLSPAWRLATLDGNWSIVLTPQSLAIATTAYTVWLEFAEEFRGALDAFHKVSSVRLLERIGLRYTNEMHDQVMSPMDWRDRINPALLGPIAETPFQRLVHGLSEARFHADDAMIALKYGAVHESTPIPQPNLPFFLLDIDCYEERPIQFDVDATMDAFARFNQAIWSLFRWSLTDEFYARLRG